MPDKPLRVAMREAMTDRFGLEDLTQFARDIDAADDVVAGDMSADELAAGLWDWAVDRGTVLQLFQDLFTARPDASDLLFALRERWFEESGAQPAIEPSFLELGLHPPTVQAAVSLGGWRFPFDVEDGDTVHYSARLLQVNEVRRTVARPEISVVVGTRDPAGFAAEWMQEMPGMGALPFPSPGKAGETRAERFSGLGLALRSAVVLVMTYPRQVIEPFRSKPEKGIEWAATTLLTPVLSLHRSWAVPSVCVECAPRSQSPAVVAKLDTALGTLAAEMDIEHWKMVAAGEPADPTRPTLADAATHLRWAVARYLERGEARWIGLVRNGLVVPRDD